ncbi:MAG: glycosyltransferase family 4 protein [Acidimicrobiia bacterium]|nr:glycosyltransferase family 4 protein [Acidimicrobiia bacterium]
MPAVYGRSLFLAVSESTRRALTTIGVPDSRIRVITEGVDAGGDGPVEGAVERAVERSSTPMFVVLGRLVPHKRVDLVLRAWRVVQPVVGGELVVIGDGPERRRLEGEGGPSVTFAGHVTDDEKWRLLRRSWLLVHGAHHEGWGIAVMEAAACGTPALAFDVAGVRDAVSDRETGVLVDFEAEFAAAWVQLAGDEAWRSRLGAGARRRAGTFSWDATVSQFLCVAQESVGVARAAA